MNEDIEAPMNRELFLSEFFSLEYIASVVTAVVFFVCLLICWRVLSNNPSLRRLGTGFGFYCLMFLVPFIPVAIDYLLGGEGDSTLLYLISEVLFLVPMLIGTYFIVSGSRRMGRVDADV